MSTDKLEIHYHLFKILVGNNLTQRQMAGVMGINLGKFNYCLKELVKKGFAEIEHFTSSDSRVAYLYNLTPHGIEEKSKVTASFLKLKMAEFEEIQQQIEELKQEVGTENRHAA